MYWNYSMFNNIICGHATTELKPFSNNYFDCCVTSPPYYGLRDYGTEPIIFGGIKTCVHEWGDNITTRKCGTPTQAKGIFEGRDLTGIQSQTELNQGNFCICCGAWRGNIGLEPTPEEYVNNLVNVFREVKRVLKKDGTLWLNLGDSYAANRSYQVGQTVGGEGGIIGEKRYGGHGSKIPYGLKPKDLIGIPWRVAFALQSDGWYLRQDIIWAKPNPMPESMKDRCTKAHEYVFLLTKSPKYYFDYESIEEEAKYDGRKDTLMKGGGKYAGEEHLQSSNANSLHKNGCERWKYKNLEYDGQQPNSMHLKRLVGEEYLSPVRRKRSVWTVTTKPFKEAHFATFPEALIEPMIKAGCPKDGIVLDPFSGAGTTAVVAKKQFKNSIGIDLSEKYCKMARNRIENTKIPNQHIISVQPIVKKRHVVSPLNTYL